MTKKANVFSHLPLVVFNSADSFGFICPGFDLSEITASTPIQNRKTEFSAELLSFEENVQNEVCAFCSVTMTLILEILDIFSHTSSMKLVMAILVSRFVDPFGRDWNISSAFVWIAMKWCRNSDRPQRLKPSDYFDPLTFPLVPSWDQHYWFWVKCLDNYWMDCHEIGAGQNFNLSDTLVYLWFTCKANDIPISCSC